MQINPISKILRKSRRLSELIQRSIYRWPIVARWIAKHFHRMYYYNDLFHQSTWLGVPILKCPLDLWIYQELLWRLKPDLIIETGTYDGGSAYYLACLMDRIGKGHILTIDVLAHKGRPAHPRITYLQASSTSEEAVQAAREASKSAAVVMVILDSDHRAPHVEKELTMLSPMVTVGSYLIVEDSNVNNHPVVPSFGPGPMEALKPFVAINPSFQIDANCEKFRLTFNPRGFLRRERP